MQPQVPEPLVYEHVSQRARDASSTDVTQVQLRAATTHAAVRPAAIRILGDLRRALDRDPAKAHAAALRLADMLAETTQECPPAARGGLAPWRKRAIEGYMREHIERPMQLRELAAQASLSVSHFCRAFKESFGTPPRQYLAQLRVERAQHLMLTTTEPLSQIALACGMADQAHLSKLFRRMRGESPSIWRRNNSSAASGSQPGA